jgi:hypothetical protein
MGREGMARRHALYKMVALVLGTNIVRREHRIPEAESIAADPNLTLLNVPRSRKKTAKKTPQKSARKKKAGKSARAAKKRTKKSRR